MFELPSQAAWYVIQTKPKKEEEAFRNLSMLGIECLLPKTLDYKICHGHSIFVEKPFFPSYLFAKLALSRHYYKVKWTKGVARFVGHSNRPIPVTQEIIEIIRNRMDEQGLVKIISELKTGDQIRIKSGPLKGLTGVFERNVPAKKRVRVLLHLVSYQASIQLHESFVEPIG